MSTKSRIFLLTSIIVAGSSLITLPIKSHLKEQVEPETRTVEVAPLSIVADYKTPEIYKAQVAEAYATPVSTTEEQEEQTPTYALLGVFRSTAYCTCPICCGKWSYLNDPDHPVGARGVELVPDYSIAVDPDIIPLGSTVYINGKEYRADDTGSAIKGNRIDIYKGTHKEAVDYAVQTIKIYTKEN